LPPRLLALRGKRRSPFLLARMKHSSTSTMPVSRRSFRSFRALKKRCLQRKDVLAFTPARAAAARTVTEALRASANFNQRSRFRSRASGVPVSALNVLAQARHL
jgi:hypothetical protein